MNMFMERSNNKREKTLIYRLFFYFIFENVYTEISSEVNNLYFISIEVFRVKHILNRRSREREMN